VLITSTLGWKIDPMRSRLRWASARGLREGGGGRSFLFGTRNFTEKFLQPETASAYLYILRLSPFY
jgi:hypothetical protein